MLPGANPRKPRSPFLIRRTVVGFVAIVAFLVAIYFLAHAVWTSRASYAGMQEDDGHHHHHHHGEDDDDDSTATCEAGDDTDGVVDEWIAELVDNKTKKVTRIATAMRRRGVMLLTRYNARPVILSSLGSLDVGDVRVNTTTTGSIPSSSITTSRADAVRAVLLLIYNPESQLNEEAHRAFVSFGEDWGILAQEEAKARSAQERSESGEAGSVPPHPRGLPEQDGAMSSVLRSITVTFAQLNAESAQDPSSTDVKESEVDYALSLDSSPEGVDAVRDGRHTTASFLRRVGGAARVDALLRDVPSVVMLWRAVGGAPPLSAVQFAGYTGELRMSHFLRFMVNTLGSSLAPSAVEAFNVAAEVHAAPTPATGGDDAAAADDRGSQQEEPGDGEIVVERRQRPKAAPVLSFEDGLLVV